MSSINDAQMRKHRGVTGRIFSIGYEGLDVSALAQRLAGARVEVLVDVRLNPVSRRPGFSKKALQAALSDAGIEYVHERDLGNPKENREAFHRGDRLAEGRELMRARLANGSGPALSRLVDLARRQRVAVMCVERDRLQCHRDVITEMVQELEPAIEVLQIL
jgi:uncharacterized protein (DUF488 family)